MSKSYDFNEIECKSCHEWWYSSEIKQGLCPMCYDYFNQLKQQLADAEEHIDALELQLREQYQLVDKKDKEIELLKHLGKHETTTEMFKENTKLIIEKKTQFAIQELEKVKTLIQNAINFEKPNFVEVYDAINKQIKELKGEKE